MEQLLASGHCEKAVWGHCLGAPILNITIGVFFVNGTHWFNLVITAKFLQTNANLAMCVFSGCTIN